MLRYALAVLCLIGLFANPARGQNTAIAPIHIAAGTVLSFHLQTRLRPDYANPLDHLPSGTILQVKILDSIDSSADRDGEQFRGVVTSQLVSGEEIIVHSESRVRLLLVLLRSKVHPEGFRYELLATHVNDHGKSYDLTASLNPSVFDDTAHPLAPSQQATLGH